MEGFHKTRHHIVSDSNSHLALIFVCFQPPEKASPGSKLRSTRNVHHCWRRPTFSLAVDFTQVFTLQLHLKQALLSLWNRPTPAKALTAASHRRVSVQSLCGLLGIMGSFKHPFGLFGLGRNEMPMLERHCQHSTFFSFLGRGLCMAHGSALACPNPLLQCSCSPQIFSGIWRRVEPRNWFSENRTMASQWSRMGPGSKLSEQTVDTCCCLCNRWKCNESWPAYPARNHQHSYHSCMKLERSTAKGWHI